MLEFSGKGELNKEIETSSWKPRLLKLSCSCVNVILKIKSVGRVIRLDPSNQIYIKTIY